MLKELSDLVEQMAMRGAEEAAISDIDKAFGQHVLPRGGALLQEATDELLGGDSAVPVFPGVGVFVAKGDLIIGQFQDAVVADGHPPDVGGQILQGSHPAADRLAVHHPLLGQRLGRDQVKQAGLLQCVTQLGPKQTAQCCSNYCCPASFWHLGQ